MVIERIPRARFLFVTADSRRGACYGQQCGYGKYTPYRVPMQHPHPRGNWSETRAQTP
jgi:hypothetical protein